MTHANLYAKPDGRTLLIPITSAWSVRNVVLSGMLDLLRSRMEVVLAVPTTFPAFNAPEDVRIERFEIRESHGRPYLDLRERLGLAHSRRTNPRVTEYNRRLGNFRKGFRDRVANNVKLIRAGLDGTGPLYQRLVRRERREWEAGADRSLGPLIQSWGVDAAFFPVPHLPAEGVLARTVSVLGIPTAAFILSFDNLSTKGRHTVTFDRYFVWNAAMQGELRRTYGEIGEDQVKVVGTPQFEFYFMEQYRGSREELCASLDLDPHRPIVLFAAGPDALVPHEVPVVRRLENDLRAVFPDRPPQVVVRLHPIERHAERWQALRDEFPSLRWSIPWKTDESNRQWGTPETADIRQLCLLMHHSDVVVNTASTMTIDALVCGTPAVCLDYVLPPFEDFVSILHNFYDYEHYRPITKSGAVRFAATPEQLVARIREYLAEPALDSRQRSELVRFMLGPKPEMAVRRMADEIQNFVGVTADAI